MGVSLPNQGHKPLFGAGLEKEQIGGEELGPVFHRGLHRGVYAFRIIGNARQQGRHHHPGGNTVFHQKLHRFQAGQRAGRAGFRAFPDRFVNAAHAENDLHIGGVIKVLQDVHIPPGQHPLGGDGCRVAVFGQRLNDAPGQPVFGFGRFVRVGSGADGDRLPRPAGRTQLAPQHLRGIDFGKHPLVELAPRVHPPELVSGARVAVAAGVAAPPIGIQCPAKGKARDIHPVQQGLAGNFLYLGFGHNTPPARSVRTPV